MDGWQNQLRSFATPSATRRSPGIAIGDTKKCCLIKEVLSEQLPVGKIEQGDPIICVVFVLALTEANADAIRNPQEGKNFSGCCMRLLCAHWIGPAIAKRLGTE